MIILLWKQSLKIENSTPAFTVKVGGENSPIPLMGEIVPNQNVNPISEDFWGIKKIGSMVS